jgi:hypothetical protein
MSDDVRLLSAVEKLETVVDKLFTRVEALETNAAAQGKPSWQAISTAIFIMLGLLTPVGWAITTSAENRVIAAELAMERRLAPLETRLGLIVAMRQP